MTKPRLFGGKARQPCGPKKSTVSECPNLSLPARVYSLGFRHSLASALISEGISIRETVRLPRHINVEIT